MSMLHTHVHVHAACPCCMSTSIVHVVCLVCPCLYCCPFPWTRTWNTDMETDKETEMDIDTEMETDKDPDLNTDLNSEKTLYLCYEITGRGLEKCAGIKQNNLVHQVKVILNGLLFHLFLISQPLIISSAEIFSYSTIASCS